jgi:hypothetical protein
MKTEEFKALTNVEQHVILMMEKMYEELKAIRYILQMEQP